MTDFRAPLLRPVPGVYLKPPMPLDTNLHVCGCEANFVTMNRLKHSLPIDVFRPNKGVRSHLRASKFSWGSMPPDPPSLILCIQYWYKSWTNAILLPPGLSFREYAQSMPP